MSRIAKIEKIKQSIIKDIKELLEDKNITEMPLPTVFESSDYDPSHGNIETFITKIRLTEQGEVQGYFENPYIYDYFPSWESLETIPVEQLEDMLTEIEEYIE